MKVLAYVSWAAMGILVSTLAIQAQPRVLAVRPTIGNGPAQTFTFTFHDDTDVGRFNVLDVLIKQTYLDGRNACYFAYEPIPGAPLTKGVVQLVGDDGGTLSTPMDLANPVMPHSPDHLSNSQCTVYASNSDIEARDGSSYDSQGNPIYRQFEVTLSIAFSQSFAGDKAIYLAGREDSFGLNTGWVPSGVWRVPGAPGPVFGISEPEPSTHIVTIGSVTPSSVNTIWELINNTQNGGLNGQSACYVSFDPTQYQAYLINDAGNDSAGQVTVGNGTAQGSGSVSNSQCTLFGLGSSYQTSGSQVTLTLQFSFNSNFLLAPSFAYEGAKISGAGTGWLTENVVGEPTPNVTVNFPQLTGPVSVEANLGPLLFDAYNDQNCINNNPACQTDLSQRWIAACDWTLTVRQCYQNALNGYHQQGVTGVRFQFNLCGDGVSSSTPLAHCDMNNGQAATWSNSSTWAQNVTAFLSDVSASGIRNITPTPALTGFADVGVQVTPNVYDPCRGVDTTLAFWPASPYAIGAEQGAVDLNNPADTTFNTAYNCSPTVPNFVGWTKILLVFDYMLSQAAHRNPALTVEEFDLTNETDLASSTVQARLIVDNTHSSSGSWTQVLSQVEGLMVTYGFDPSRVTLSSVVIESGNPSADCGSYYGDSARILRTSSLVAAISGSVFGASPLQFDFSNGNLPCSASAPANAVTTDGAPGPSALPDILDQHDGPRISGPGGDVTYATQSDTATTAQTLFDDVEIFMNSFCPGQWRNPTGDPSRASLCLSNALYMLGETDLYVPNNPYRYGVNCAEAPLATPAGAVQGYNQSTLKGRRLPSGVPGTVWRPWLNPAFVPGPTTVTCYNFPDNLSHWYTPVP